ncbi:hypothetical protein WA577_006427 [Blastocystis sp. JDR]
MFRFSSALVRNALPSLARARPAVSPLCSSLRLLSTEAKEAAPEGSDRVSLTEDCAKHIIKIAKRKNIPLDKVHLRVAVQSGGCSGLQYKFTMDYDKLYDYDTEFIDPSGARLVLDTVSLGYMKGSTIDWEDSLVRTGFVVSKNPNAAASCSCGTSFTAKTSNPYE